MCLSIAVNHPKRVLAKGEHKGHEWVVVSNHMGIRCGYVRVGPGHPLYGKGYDEVYDCGFDGGNVHGGLTFSEADVSCGKGGADDGWWFGFDCGHYQDAPDPELVDRFADPVTAAYLKSFPLSGEGVVRTQEYVEDECRKLAESFLLYAAEKQ